MLLDPSASFIHPRRFIDDEASIGVHLRSPFQSFSGLWQRDGSLLLDLVPWASHRAVTSTARQGENRHWTLAWVCCPFTSFLTTFHSTKATSCRTFPVNARPHGIGGLLIRETFGELQNRG